MSIQWMKRLFVSTFLKRLRAKGTLFAPMLFDLLLQLTDLNLSKIMGELQKLYLYALETKTITRGAVQELVPKSLEHNVFLI